MAFSVLTATALPAAAQDATWTGATNNNFNTATNWTPIKTWNASSTGTAFFGTSATTSLSFTTATAVDGWTFNVGASNYTFNINRNLDFNGAGITINGGGATLTIDATHNLHFNNASSAGNANITNNNNLDFFLNSSAGNSTITNNDNLDFNDSSTAGNATITSTGTLEFFTDSTAGNATITSSGTVNFHDSSTANNANITNSGTMNFRDSSTASNATIINSGTLNFRNSSTAGNATITNNVGGTLDFFNTSTAANANITNNAELDFNTGSTAGNATITNNSGGLGVDFLGTSTAGNATITNNGFLHFHGSSTAENAAITNNSGGTVDFLGTSTAGNATITNNLGGVVDFSASSGPGGLNKLTAGSIAGAGNYYLGHNELTVGGNNLSTTVSGVISDCGPTGVECNVQNVGGSLVKTGTGTLTLSGANTYTGGTTVNAGTLLVDGSIVSATTINNGGTLGGSGTVGNVTVANGGTFAPGPVGAPGTITVNGNLIFQPSSTYLINSATTVSLANVSGSATLTGGSVQANGSFVRDSNTILHARGGLGGTRFSGLTVSDPNFRGSLSYTTTDVFLNLIAQLGNPGGLNRNQQNVANALDNVFNSGGTLTPAFEAIFLLTGSDLANALSALSGEAATGAQQVAFQLTNQFLGLMLDPFVDGRGGMGGGPALAFAPEREALPADVAQAYAKVLKESGHKAPPTFEQRWTTWASGYGGYNETKGDAVTGSHDLTARVAGGAVGSDYHVTRDTVVGFALAGGGTNWGLAQGLGGGRSDAFQAGAYAATRWGPAYVAAAFGFSNHWMSTDRFAPFGDHLTADFSAQSYGGRLESGYRFGTPAVGMTPYAALQAQSFHTPAYNETDVNGGGFALNYDARTATDTRSELGSRFDYLAAANADLVLTLRGRVAWAHDWISDPSLTAVFQALPGATFIVNGATPAKDSALASGETELRLASGVSFLVKFDGEFANHSQTYAGTGTLRFSW